MGNHGVKPSTLKAFLRQYEIYARSVLTPTSREIKDLLETWADHDFWSQTHVLGRTPIPSPVQSRRVRIKRPESVVDKIQRKPDSFPDGLALDSVRTMRDAVAARIVVYFLSQLPLIDQTIRDSDVLEVSKDDPPVAYHGQDTLQRLGLARGIDHEQKDSGYTSIHYIVRLRRSAVPKGDRPWFEIQVRTLAEHLWGEIEHVLGYKPDKKTSFAVKKQFKIIGNHLSTIDEHFNFLYEELTRFQAEGVYSEEDILNAENLPPVLNHVGIACAQKEIDGLLKLLASRGLRTVGTFMSVATKANIDLVKEVYRKHEGRFPISFEVVASLAAIRGLPNSKAVVDAIRTQMEFLNVWSDIQSHAKREPHRRPNGRTRRARRRQR